MHICQNCGKKTKYHYRQYCCEDCMLYGGIKFPIDFFGAYITKEYYTELVKECNKEMPCA